MSASKLVVKTSNMIHNTALGACRISPLESLYCNAKELPLSFRRKQLPLAYAAEVSGSPRNPVYEVFKSFYPNVQKTTTDIIVIFHTNCKQQFSSNSIVRILLMMHTTHMLRKIHQWSAVPYSIVLQQ